MSDTTPKSIVKYPEFDASAKKHFNKWFRKAIFALQTNQIYDVARKERIIVQLLGKEDWFVRAFSIEDITKSRTYPPWQEFTRAVKAIYVNVNSSNENRYLIRTLSDSSYTDPQAFWDIFMDLAEDTEGYNADEFCADFLQAIKNSDVRCCISEFIHKRKIVENNFDLDLMGQYYVQMHAIYVPKRTRQTAVSHSQVTEEEQDFENFQAVVPYNASRQPSQPARSSLCYSCGKPGHYSNRCPNRGRNTWSRVAPRSHLPPLKPRNPQRTFSRRSPTNKRRFKGRDKAKRHFKTGTSGNPFAKLLNFLLCEVSESSTPLTEETFESSLDEVETLVNQATESDAEEDSLETWFKIFQFLIDDQEFESMFADEDPVSFRQNLIWLGDSWIPPDTALLGSAIEINSGITEFVPTLTGAERHILELVDELGEWLRYRGEPTFEDDLYLECHLVKM